MSGDPSQSARQMASRRITQDTPEKEALMQTCSQIGALIIGQRHDRVGSAVGILQKQAAGVLLKQYVDHWLPRFHQHVEALEAVVGKGLELDGSNLIQDLRTKISAAGFKNTREFITKLVLPVVSYHGTLLFLNNEAKVVLPPEVREEVVEKMNAINKLLGGACAAMVLQESMGL